MNDRDIERLAEEANDPGDAQASAPAPVEVQVQAEEPVEAMDPGEDESVVIIQNPDTGQLYLAQELTAEDLADMGLEISTGEEESGE